MDPFSVAAIAGGALGRLFGGRSKKKAAKKQQRKALKAAESDYKLALKNREADQRDVAALTREDEARMRKEWEAMDRGAGGYDFQKLVEEAKAAGFNPLTALEMTGASNYGREMAPILTTPFFARPNRDTVSAVVGTGQAVVENSGYVGDAIAGAASGILDLRLEEARNATEIAIAQAYTRGQGVGPVTGSSAFGSPVNTVDARPTSGGLGAGFAGPVFGNPGDITASAIDENEHLFRVVRGKDGQLIVQPNMDVASDFETMIATELNNGTLYQWGENIIRKNTMHERDYRLWALSDIAERAIERAEPSRQEQMRTQGFTQGPFGVWMRPRRDGGSALRITIE